MKIRVLFFSVLQDVTHTDEAALDMAPGSTVADFLETIYSKWPNLRAWDASILMAVDQEYVKRDVTLHENAEVAIMPPVQGG